MSHEYPYRQPPADSDLRPAPGSYNSSDRHHASLDRDIYRPSQEICSSSHPSLDGALSILSSCGLEPKDLSLLAELPEDVLTVESLPHVLNQIKGKRGTIRSFPSNALSSSSSSSSHSLSSACRPALCSSTRYWDHLGVQPVQYPVDHISPSPLPSEKVRDHWGGPRTSSSVRAEPPSSSLSSSYTVDLRHRSGPSEYGKKGRATGPLSPPDRPSVRSAGREERTCPLRPAESRSAGFRSALPREEYHVKRAGRHPKPEAAPLRSSRDAVTISMPNKKEALDFQGTLPEVFPYSCSLCDITVLSERVWVQHVNGTQHADGQLRLLQRFPKWDCRMETVSGAVNQSQKSKDEDKSTRLPQTANSDQKPQPNKQPSNKKADKCKVVCVKFPAQSVDETYLRKLIQPFGKIIKILMFPSLAFVELGSADQAKDLVKVHVSYPPTVNGEQMEFSISNTFSFLQSSRVMSFTPAPTGDDGQSDLISIVKRFGSLLYTLFLPSIAFVEMKNKSDAQKMVDYYSSNTLRINNDIIRVSFSGEYKSLVHISSATKYEEEPPLSKRERSHSQEQQEKTETKKRRSRSRDKSKSREKTSRETRTRARSKSRDQSARQNRSRSPQRNQSREKMVESEEVKKLDSESRTYAELPQPTPSKPESTVTGQHEESSAEESDIEGMEVIGENLEDEDKETMEESEEHQDEEVENHCPAERMESSGEEEVKNEEETAAGAQLEDAEENAEFPFDLENCITLDELAEEESNDEGSTAEPEIPATDVDNVGKLNRQPELEEGAAEPESLKKLQPEPGRGAAEPEKLKSEPEGGVAEQEMLKKLEPEPQGGPTEPEKLKSEREGGTAEQEMLKKVEPKPEGGTAEPEKLKPDPQGGTAERQEPTKPVGTKFVRPVVAYFCELCQVIYADEDEAKVQHCSSLMHYRKYQEKTGDDPWIS